MSPKEPFKESLFMYNIDILVICYFRFLIDFNIFLDFGPLGGVPPPIPPCFFLGAAAPRLPRPSGFVSDIFFAVKL